jgi:hypothetical protein
MAIPAPTEQEIRLKFSDLIAGRCTREEADRWAGQWVYTNDPPRMPEHSWNALLRFAGCDSTHGSPGDYKHSEEQFQEWLVEFNAYAESSSAT